MKLPCNIVQDLLPLYEDGLCSEESRAAIEEHLKECESCRTQFDQLKMFARPDLPEQLPQEEQAVVKSLRKIRRKWGLSLISLLLVIPLVLMSINQYRKTGICFTNIDEMIAAGKYAYALAEGDYEKAAACMDYEGLYYEILELLDMESADYKREWISVTIGTEEWLVSDNFYQHYLPYNEDPLQLWSYLTYNHFPQIMIPSDIWDEVTALQPDLLHETADGELYLGDIQYLQIDTQWGSFHIPATSSITDCVTAYDFTTTLDLVPLEIYEETKAELDTEADKHYEYIQTTYAEVADMTLAEFTEYVQNAYTEDLHSITNLGISFSSARYSDSYLIEDEWNITYKVLVTVDGQNYPLYLDFRMGNDGLDIPSMSHPSDFPGNDEMTEALFLHYPVEK